jgi:photosystem II stability/assembly factor-like uncharacterized protein
MGRMDKVRFIIVLVLILTGGFVGAVSAPRIPATGDVVLNLQDEPAREPPAAEPVGRNLGPGGGGWIQSICASPQRDGELLVGCDVGGFYRSTDGGAGYTISNAGLQDYFVECIVPDPVDPNVIYLGCESGVYKSTDRGGSWQWLREGFPPKNRWDFSAPIGALAIDPRNPAVLYAGIGRPRWQQFGKGAVYKTVDGGGHWQQVNAPGSLPADALVTDLVIDVRDSRRLFLACQYGLYRSDDAGIGWSLTIDGLPHPHVRRLAQCRAQPDVFYLTLWSPPGQTPWQGGVYRSIDGGRSWVPRTNGLTQSVGKPGEPGPMTANYDRLVVHPDNPDVVYVGGCSWVNANIYKTTDGGRNWTRTVRRGAGGNTEDGWITFWGPDVQCLSMSPFDPETLYFGTSGKVHKTTDGGDHWQQIYTRMLPDGRFQGLGLEVTCVVDVVVHPQDPQRLYFCYLDIGLLISRDGGQSFRRGGQGLTPGGMEGNCYALAFDPGDTGHCWGSFGNGSAGVIAESFDSGDAWETVGTAATGLPEVVHRVLRADAAGRLATVAERLGVYVSEDNGRTWQARNEGLPHGDVRGLVLDPQQPGPWWCVLADDGTNPGAVYRSDDAGRTWRPVSRGLAVADVQRLVLAPGDPPRLCLAVRERYMGGRVYPGGVYCSDNGGGTWRHILSDDFVQGLAVDPRDADVIYAGLTDHPYHDESTGDGLRMTRDGGKTWSPLNGLSSQHVSCITVAPHDPNQLYLGTGGNGVLAGRVPDPEQK